MATTMFRTTVFIRLFTLALALGVIGLGNTTVHAQTAFELFLKDDSTFDEGDAQDLLDPAAPGDMLADPTEPPDLDSDGKDVLVRKSAYPGFIWMTPPPNKKGAAEFHEEIPESHLQGASS